MSSRIPTYPRVPQSVYHRSRKIDFGNLTPKTLNNDVAAKDPVLIMEALPTCKEVDLNSQIAGSCKAAYSGKRSKTRQRGTKQARAKPLTVRLTTRASKMKQRTVRPRATAAKTKNLNHKSPNKTAKKKAIIRNDAKSKAATSKRKVGVKRQTTKPAITRNRATKSPGGGIPSAKVKAQRKTSRCPTSKKSSQIKTSASQKVKAVRDIKSTITKKSVGDAMKKKRSYGQKKTQNSGSIGKESSVSPNKAKKLPEHKAEKGATRRSIVGQKRKRAVVEITSSPITKKKMLKPEVKQIASESWDADVVPKRQGLLQEQKAEKRGNKDNEPKKRARAGKGSQETAASGRSEEKGRKPRTREKTNISSDAETVKTLNDKTVVIRMRTDEGYQYLLKPASPKQSKRKGKKGILETEAVCNSPTAQPNICQKESKKTARPASPLGKTTQQSSPRKTKANPQITENCQMDQGENSEKGEAQMTKSDALKFKEYLALKENESVTTDLPLEYSVEMMANTDDGGDDEKIKGKSHVETYRKSTSRKRMSNTKKRANSTKKRGKTASQKRRKLQSKQKKSPQRKAGKTQRR